jgi:hypothetical protein
MFHMEIMKQTLCACGEIARPSQRNCHRCHALANQVYRARVKHEAEKLKKLFLRMIVRNVTLVEAPETCNTNR